MEKKLQNLTLAGLVVLESLHATSLEGGSVEAWLVQTKTFLSGEEQCHQSSYLENSYKVDVVKLD